MPKPIDLPRIRRALAELDRIAVDHPELIGQGAPWAENLDQLEEILMPEDKTEYHARTNAERMRDFRAREKAKGLHRITAALTPEAAETLTVLRTVYPDLNVGEIVSRALIRLALDKVAPR